MFTSTSVSAKMGRTNGKLKKFLRDSLQNKCFSNLKWEDPDSLIFSLKLPRFERRRDLSDYERILIEWYVTNNRTYPGYSGAKAVLQAALKKSVYLVCLNHNSNDLRIKFATKAEEIEKRRKQKLVSNSILPAPSPEASNLNLTSIKPEVSIKPEMSTLRKLEYSFSSLSADPSQETSNLNLISTKPEVSIKPEMSTLCGLEHSFSLSADPPLPSFSPPLFSPSLSPSPSNSSGYQSGNEDMDDNISVSEDAISDDPVLLDALDDLLQNPDKYINGLQNIPNDIEMDIIPSDIDGSIANVPQDSTKINDADFMQPSVRFPEKPVIELTATEVNSSETLSTYWLCTRKLYVDTILLLICDKQVIKDENQGITPGQIDLNNVLEPGESYHLQKMFEIDGKCFLFLSRNR